MRKNNESEARALAYKQVPRTDAEDVVGACITRLVHNCPAGGPFDEAEHELTDVVENLRDAHAGAIEERLDLRDAILELADMLDYVERDADEAGLVSREFSNLMDAIRALAKSVK
jgi:hypothetical protein